MIPSLTPPPPSSGGQEFDHWGLCVGWGEGWRRTTSTCLADCWCSHRPLASCHLWGRREAADTPRGSCSLAHNATESLTHQGGKEGGGRGDNISIMFAIRFRLVSTQTTVQTPEGGRAKEVSRSLQRLGLWFCPPLDSAVHHCKPHYLAQRPCVTCVKGKKVNGNHHRAPRLFESPNGVPTTATYSMWPSEFGPAKSTDLVYLSQNQSRLPEEKK